MSTTVQYNLSFSDEDVSQIISVCATDSSVYHNELTKAVDTIVHPDALIYIENGDTILEKLNDTFQIAQDTSHMLGLSSTMLNKMVSVRDNGDSTFTEEEVALLLFLLKRKVDFYNAQFAKYSDIHLEYLLQEDFEYKGCTKQQSYNCMNLYQEHLLDIFPLIHSIINQVR